MLRSRLRIFRAYFFLTYCKTHTTKKKKDTTTTTKYEGYTPIYHHYNHTNCLVLPLKKNN